MKLSGPADYDCVELWDDVVAVSWKDWPFCCFTLRNPSLTFDLDLELSHHRAPGKPFLNRSSTSSSVLQL